MISNSLNATTLTALRNLNGINLELNRSAQRLATGLAINRGADGPADLISSERLRAALATLEAESAALQRIDQVATTADGALSEVSTLLTDASGLQLQLANDGALSDDEKAAIQGQLDSILQSVDRISNSTQLNGQTLLNGSANLTAAGETLALPNVSSSNLGAVDAGGETVHLSDIGSGGALAGDHETAQQVLDAAISEVATARGQIGSFQTFTIDTRLKSIGTQIELTTEAESLIRDTEYAFEVANFARLRTLSNVSIKTLAVLNRNQDEVLNLL